MKKETNDYAKRWIEQGKPCRYRYGWIWDGAGARQLTKEEALKKLPSYGFGIGLYCLSFINIDGVETLEFNELPGNALL